MKNSNKDFIEEYVEEQHVKFNLFAQYKYFIKCVQPLCGFCMDILGKAELTHLSYCFNPEIQNYSFGKNI